VIGCQVIATNGYANHIRLKKLLGQGPYFFRPRGREHHRLTAWKKDAQEEPGEEYSQWKRQAADVIYAVPSLYQAAHAAVNFKLL